MKVRPTTSACTAHLGRKMDQATQLARPSIRAASSISSGMPIDAAHHEDLEGPIITQPSTRRAACCGSSYHHLKQGKHDGLERKIADRT